VAYHLSWGVILLGSYHPSQQNTFTGKLTRSMFHSVFQRARKEIDSA
jgi:uracil-DNA glycosylase